MCSLDQIVKAFSVKTRKIVCKISRGKIALEKKVLHEVRKKKMKE